MKNKIKLSVCTFENGDFDVIIIDAETHEEVTLSGNQKLNEDDSEIVNKLAPACVYTTYKEI